MLWDEIPRYLKYSWTDDFKVSGTKLSIKKQKRVNIYGLKKEIVLIRMIRKIAYSKFKLPEYISS